MGKAKPADRAELHIERAREFLASGAVGEAEKQFREALAQDIASPGAHAGLAHALLIENKLPQARYEAAAANRLRPSAEAYLVLARADLHDKDDGAAQQNLQKALSLEPDSADAKAVEREIQSHTADNGPQ